MMEHRTLAPNRFPFRSVAMEWNDYSGLDRGIAFAIKVLNAAGIETCQSCEGGKGHAYAVPTVDIPASHDDATGFAAVAALVKYGLPVRDVSLVWNVDAGGLIYERLWRITFREKLTKRAKEIPQFVTAYRATEKDGR